MSDPHPADGDPASVTVVVELDQFQKALLDQVKADRAQLDRDDGDVAFDLVREYLEQRPGRPG